MKTIIKIVGVLAALLVLVAVGLLIAAKILITPERVRQVVIPIAEEQLDRPVSIGEIDVRLLSGIVISNFTVGSKDEPEDFLSAESMILRYQFWPLLRRSVIVDEVRLISPHIRVVRYKTGKFNFSDLLDKEKVDEPVDVEVDRADGPSLDLLVKEVSISGGRLIFIDQMVEREYLLSDLMASVTEFSLDQPFPFDISAKLDDAPIRINGRLNPETNHVSTDIRIQGLDVAAFMPYAPDDFPGTLSGLKLGVDIRANANQEAVDSSGMITLSDIDLVLNEMPDAAIEKGRVSFDYEVGVDLVAENIIISRANADINGVGLEVTGSVASYGNEPVLDLNARVPMILLSDIIAAVPRSLVADIIEMRPQGRIGAQVHIKGSPERPEELLQRGEVSLEQVGVTINELSPQLTGTINIVKDSASSDNLVVNLAGDRVYMAFSANNLLGKIINVKHSVTAEKLDIDRLLAALGAGEEDPGPPPEEPGEPGELGPFDLPLEVAGEVRVAQALFQGMAVEMFDLRYLLKDNVLTVDHLRGDIAGGTISGKARAELNRQPIAYTGNISVAQVRAEKFIDALFPAAANSVFGTMFLNADIKGEGTTWDVISQTLTSNSDFKVAQGRMTGEGLVGGLASFLDTQRLAVLDFASWEGDVTLKDGDFQINSRLNSDEIRMAPAGTIGLDGDLSLSLDLRVSPKLASQIGGRDLIAHLEKTNDGWTILPMSVAGTIRSPRFDLDVSAVTDRLKERGREELQKQLQERVLDRFLPQGDANDGEKPDGKEKPPVEKKMEDTLRKLFR